jgi:hypothetical protein
MEPPLWRQYDQLVDLYRYYLELVLKTASAFWLIVGGILAFAFANSDQPDARWALVVPVVMSVSLLVMTLWVRPMSRELCDAIEELADELGVRQRVHAVLLVRTVSAIIGLLILVAGLMVWFLVAFPQR